MSQPTSTPSSTHPPAIPVSMSIAQTMNLVHRAALASNGGIVNHGLHVQDGRAYFHNHARGLPQASAQRYIVVPQSQIPNYNVIQPNTPLTTGRQPKIKVVGNQSVPTQLIPIEVYTTQSPAKPPDGTPQPFYSNFLGQTGMPVGVRMQMMPQVQYIRPSEQQLLSLQKACNAAAKQEDIKQEAKKPGETTPLPLVIAQPGKKASTTTTTTTPAGTIVCFKIPLMLHTHEASGADFREKRGVAGPVEHDFCGVPLKDQETRKRREKEAQKVVEIEETRIVAEMKKKRGSIGTGEKRTSHVILEERGVKIEEKSFEMGKDMEGMMMGAEPTETTPPQRKRHRTTEVEKLMKQDFGPKEQGPRILETQSRSEDKRQDGGDTDSERVTRSRRSTETPVNEPRESRRRRNLPREAKDETIKTKRQLEEEKGEEIQKLMRQHEEERSAASSSSPSIISSHLERSEDSCNHCKRSFAQAGRLLTFPQFCSKRCVKESHIPAPERNKQERSPEELAESKRNLDEILPREVVVTNGESMKEKVKVEEKIVSHMRKEDELEFVRTVPLKNWKTKQVMKWVKSVTEDDAVAKLFEEELVDGESLCMIKHDDLKTSFNMRLGPSLKLINAIEALKNSQ